MFQSRPALAGVLLAVLGAACGGRAAPEGAAPAEPGALEVVNRSSSDMDIFAVRPGQRVRIGFAPGNSTTRFRLSDAQVVGGGTVRFDAVPLGPPGRGVSSEPLIIGTGDVITLDVPPP